MNIAQSAVGSAVANCTHFLAKYPQLANPCQLEIQVKEEPDGLYKEDYLPDLVIQ